MTDKISVDKSALRSLLRALNGHGHEIRELQVTRTPEDLFPDNPINRLTKDYYTTVRLAPSRKGRLYLAGPMTGYPEHNFPAFNAEAILLRAEDWFVINPADHGYVEGAEWGDYLRYDIAKLADCERIHLLPGWEKSKGVQLELHIAKALGMEVTLAEGAQSPPAEPKRYETQAGESVSGIALRELGSEDRWQEIARLNAAAFPDLGPHQYLPVGSMLNMPPYEICTGLKQVSVAYAANTGETDNYSPAKIGALLNAAVGQIKYLSEALTNLSEGDDEPHDPSEEQQLVERIRPVITFLSTKGR